MIPILWLDLETRSRCDLISRGIYNYAADPSTKILVACWARDDGPVRTWEAWRARTMPAELRNALGDPRYEIRAHNAAFERLVMAGVWEIRPALRRFHCTAFQARSCSMPGSLGDLARAITAKMQKDYRGVELIRLLSIPRPDGTFNDDPVLLKEFGAYCAVDVGAMRESSKMLPALDAAARALYLASEEVNDRGLPIDTELCKAATQYAQAEAAEAEASIGEITGGDLTKARGAHLTRWVFEHLPEWAQPQMQVYKDGEKRLTLDKDVRTTLLAMAEEQPEEFDERVIEVIEANDAVSAASVAKFAAMSRRVSPDGRLRGAFIAAGASGTGRFSSHGAQLHNFPRVTAENPEAIRKLIIAGDPLPGSAIQSLKSMLRPAIAAGRGKRIIRGDWSAIEARVLPWLSKGPGSENYLAAFADPRRDIYVEQALIAGLGEFRQGGKVVVLSLGYGGALGALTAMARGYGVELPPNAAQIPTRWRRANVWAPQFWRQLSSAARANGPAGRIMFGTAFKDAMPARLATLPSGRSIHYPFPEFDEEGDLTYLKAAWKPKKDAKSWPRARAWGGLLAENVTQAASADLLREALVRAVRMGLPVIGHVHDELVLEESESKAALTAKTLKRTMLIAPEWARGLPLAVETDVSRRYRK